MAEGIESQEQLSTLDEMGCEMAQGFFLARPSPAEVVERLLGLEADGPALASSAR